MTQVTQDCEFSLLRSHFEFTEVDLQELFMNRAGTTSSATASTSQLCEELEEAEIGHWQAGKREHEVSPLTKPGVEAVPEQVDEAASMFYFASIPAEESPLLSKSSSQPDCKCKKDMQEVEPQTLPPWLALDQ